MTITTRDGLINAMGNLNTQVVIDKLSIANAAAGQFHSLWRAGGQPAAGAIPGAAAVCDNALIGCLPFADQTSPVTSYLGWAQITVAVLGMFEIHDRLMHTGGLSGTVTTAQTANVDLHANLATANLAARIGKSDYSEVNWWLEWYTDTGATASNATVNVTYNDGTSGDLAVVAVGGTVRASRMIPLNNLIPAAKAGLFIRDVNTVTLSASTTVAGSFGVTATRLRAGLPQQFVNFAQIFDWTELGLPDVPNDSCLMLNVLASNTTTGVVRGYARLLHG